MYSASALASCCHWEEPMSDVLCHPQRSDLISKLPSTFKVFCENAQPPAQSLTKERQKLRSTWMNAQQQTPRSWTRLQLHMTALYHYHHWSPLLLFCAAPSAALSSTPVSTCCFSLLQLLLFCIWVMFSLSARGGCARKKTKHQIWMHPIKVLF